MAETKIAAEIFADINKQRDKRIFRNNIGLGWVGELLKQGTDYILLKNPRPVKFGVGGDGAADYIGFYSIIITPEMVGKKVAIFSSIESMDKGKKIKKGGAQDDWRSFVKMFGGIAGQARSVEEANSVFDNWLREVKQRIL